MQGIVVTKRKVLSVLILTAAALLVIPVAPAFSDNFTVTPVAGVDTSDGGFAPERLLAEDNVFEEYVARGAQYDPDVYQEYRFVIPRFPKGSYLTSVELTLAFLEKSLGGAKVQIWIQDEQKWVEEPIDTASTEGVEIVFRKSLLEYVKTPSSAENIVLRFLAYSHGWNGAAGVDWVKVDFSYGTDRAGNEGQAPAEGLKSDGPPVFQNITPAPGSSVDTTTPTIAMDVTDSTEGVNESSILLAVNDVDVTAETAITAITDGFHLSYTPSVPLPLGSEVAVRAGAQDNAGNPGLQEHAFYINMLYLSGDIIINVNHADSAAQAIYDACGLVTRLADAGFTVDWVIRTGKAYGATDFSAQVDLTPNPSTPGPDGTVQLHDYAAGPFIIRDPIPATPDYNEAWDTIIAISTQQGYVVNFDELRESLSISRDDVYFITYMPAIALADDNLANIEVNLAKIPYVYMEAPGTASDPATVAGGALFSEEIDPLCGRLRLYDLYIQGHYDWTGPNPDELAAIDELDLFIRKAGMPIFECLSASIEDTAHWITEPGYDIVEGNAVNANFTPQATRIDHPFLQTMGDIPIENGGFAIWDDQLNHFRPNLQNILYDAANNDIGYIFGAVGSGKTYYMGGHKRQVLSDRRLVLDGILYNVVYPKYYRVFDPEVLVRGDTTEVTVSIVVTGGSRSLDNVVVDTFDPYSEFVPGSVTLFVPGSSYTFDDVNRRLSLDVGDFDPIDYPGGVIGTYKVLVTVPFEGFIKVLDHSNSYTDEWGARYTFESTGCAAVRVVPPLKIDKYGNPGCLPVGKTTRVTLTLAVNNYSASHSLVDVIATDGLPAGVSFVPGSIQASTGEADWGETVPNELTWTIGTMVPGDSAVLTFQVDVTPTAAGTFLINDGASITGTTAELLPVSDRSGDITAPAVAGQGILNFSLTPATADPGQPTAFTFSARNIANTAEPFVHRKDYIELAIPRQWGTPTNVTVPVLPTANWFYTWSPVTRKLKFMYKGADFTWSAGAAYTFWFQLVAPARPRIDLFDAAGTLDSEQHRFTEQFPVKVDQEAAVDIEADRSGPASPCETVYYAHTITNLGNGYDVIDVLTASLFGWEVRLYHDADGSGTYTEGDTPLADTDGDLEPDTGPLGASPSFRLLVGVVVPPTGSADQTEMTQIFARSSFDPTVIDNNVDETQVGPALSVNITPDSPATCAGGCVTLDAGGGYASYQWDGGATTQTIQVCPPADTQYSVTVTDSFGCEAQDAATVIVHPLPSFSISPQNPEICFGDSIVLDAGAGFASYQWSTGETTQSVSVSPTETAVYAATVTNDFGCQSQQGDTVTVHPLPELAVLPADPAVCAGHSITLDAGAGYSSYEWSTGETTQTITVSPAATAGYTVDVTNEWDCGAQADVTVTVYEETPITILPENPAICEGSCVTLDAGPGFSAYAWSTGDTSQSTVVCPTSTTTYSVNVIDMNGCAGTRDATVTVHALPEIAITPSQVEICEGESVTLDSTDGFAGYAWSTGETTRTITVQPAATTAYTLRVTDSNGCEAEESVTITVHSLPQPSISPQNPQLCPGETAVLDAGAGFSTYAWSTGETTQAIAVRPALTTTYSVTVTSEFGCTGESETTVTVGSAIQVSITPSSPEVCQGDSVTLDAGPGFETYLWSTGETTPTITVQPDSTTIYSVDVQTETGCMGSGETQVVVLPWVEGSAGNVLKVTKSGDTAVLDWSQGDSARRYDVDSATLNDFSDGHVLSEVPTGKEFRHEGIVGDGIPYFYRVVPFQCPGPDR